MAHENSRYRYIVLVMLILVYSVNYLDRQLVSVLAPIIKADLKLSDSQLGVLGGIAFAAIYATLSIPCAMLADRSNRTWVITAALATWSGFTALCGMATSFVHLFFFRLGVGVGEAGGVAPSYSVVAAYFPPHQRARALSVYSLGGPIGAASGYIIGGWVAHAASWRAAFIAIGIFGLVLAPTFRLIVKEPVRESQPAHEKLSARAAFRLLASKPTFWLISWGSAIAGVCSTAVLFWLPSFMQRSHQMETVSSSQFVGSVVLIAGFVGLLAGGWLSEHFGARDHGAYLRIPGMAFLVCLPLMATGFFISSLIPSFVLLTLALTMTYFFLGPCLATVQALVPESMRSTAPACMLLIVNLVSLGVGPWLVGALSDAMTPAFGTEALRWALIFTFPLYGIAGIMLIAASKIMKRDAVDAALIQSDV